MAPVRRTLVATWMAEGSSVVAKIEGIDRGSSMGPSSVAVVSSASWVSRGEIAGGMAETE